jgi:hypothetical protein
MLSRARISAPQAGHLDRGRTMDSPLGSLPITTVKKDPKIRPSPENRATSTAEMLADAVQQSCEAWKGSHSEKLRRVTLTSPAGRFWNHSGVSSMFELPPCAENPSA